MSGFAEILSEREKQGIGTRRELKMSEGNDLSEADLLQKSDSFCGNAIN